MFLNDQNEVTLDLYSWVHHTITLASTDAVYGPANPFQDPKVEKGFW